ncbi:hypothetical protein ACLOJK_009129 [Asimina triloba]
MATNGLFGPTFEMRGNTYIFAFSGASGLFMKSFCRRSGEKHCRGKPEFGASHLTRSFAAVSHEVAVSVRGDFPAKDRGHFRHSVVSSPQQPLCFSVYCHSTPSSAALFSTVAPPTALSLSLSLSLSPRRKREAKALGSEKQKRWRQVEEQEQMGVEKCSTLTAFFLEMALWAPYGLPRTAGGSLESSKLRKQTFLLLLHESNVVLRMSIHPNSSVLCLIIIRRVSEIVFSVECITSTSMFG